MLRWPVLVDDHGVAHRVTHQTTEYLLVRCFGGSIPWLEQALEYGPTTCLECLCLRSKP